MKKLINDDTNWDLGFGELIEETPLIDPKRPTKFSKVIDIDGARLYLNRPAPSWVSSDRSAA